MRCRVSLAQFSMQIKAKDPERLKHEVQIHAHFPSLDQRDPLPRNPGFLGQLGLGPPQFLASVADESTDIV
jgi:hypothetical protein